MIRSCLSSAFSLNSQVLFFSHPTLLLHSQSDVVLDDLAPTKRLHDLGIEATSMETPGFTFLHRFRTGSHYLDMKKI